MARIIEKGLREQSFAVDIARNGEEALYSADINTYDLAILDVMLPLKDGFAVCRELRRKKFWSPVLMLSARSGVEERVTGLNCGADDYLTKPFDFRELLARIRALTRRAGEVRPSEIQIADLKLDTLGHSAKRGDRSISLTAKEYALLELFMLRPGHILGREVIAEHVWNETFDPLSNVIDVYVRRLRAKVDDGSDRPLLHTRRGEGYFLSANP